LKGLVVGGGSIGKRHLQNLKTLGVGELGLVETDAQRRGELAATLELTPFASIADGLQWSPDFALVATPTYLHVQQALEIARYGCDIFVEKPLSHTPDGLAELIDLIERKKLISLVGCNMRFHPGPAKVKELLRQKVLGKTLFARISCGSYLPQWRPGTDYRSNYAALEKTGGGCILDGIHEIDLARWYLGEVEQVMCFSAHLSSLDIATEDVAAMIFRHESGAVSEVHLDYVQRTYDRGCQIAGEAGSIFWDFNLKQVRWYEATANRWNSFDQPVDWQVNRMYVDEMSHFLDCIAHRKPTTLPVAEAGFVMQIVFAGKAAAREGRMVEVPTQVRA
jgi:predicted dehydrogenase